MVVAPVVTKLFGYIFPKLGVSVIVDPVGIFVVLKVRVNVVLAPRVTLPIVLIVPEYVVAGFCTTTFALALTVAPFAPKHAIV